jgi:flagellar biosynthesis GTPase FlhF
MTSGRLHLPVIVVVGLMTPVAALAQGSAPQVAPDSSPPTALEQALVEQACGAVRPVSPRVDARDECVSAQLLALRSDFGRDLSRLSAAERRTLDSVCSKVRDVSGRDAYLNCLNAQLVGVRNRRKPAARAPLDAASAEAPPPPTDVPPPAPAPPPQPSGFSAVRIAVASSMVVVGAAGLVVVLRKRRKAHQCRVCGGRSESGSLCQKCRHEAAEAVRQAAAERAEQQRAREEEARKQREREEMIQQKQIRLKEAEEAARVRQLEQERLRSEAARSQAETSPAPATAAVVQAAPEEVFDPYIVLGVERGANAEVIRAAYMAALQKYDPEQVSHLGGDIQAHYKMKAQAVERAFQMLTYQ